MIGGIDSQVQQRVEAYRGNPQGLAMQYQQNQQLIDLLALQKLKSEKEAAAREIQMQMQGEPSTIADQREQQVAQLTQQEVSQKLMGSVPNMEQGIGALPGVQQSPMQGGIASFQEGGEVTSFQEGGDVQSKIYAALRAGASIRDLERIYRNTPQIMAFLQSIAPTAGSGGNVPYGQEFDEEGPTGVREGLAIDRLQGGFKPTYEDEVDEEKEEAQRIRGVAFDRKRTPMISTDALFGLLGLPEVPAPSVLDPSAPASMRPYFTQAPTQVPEVAAAAAPEEDFLVEDPAAPPMPTAPAMPTMAAPTGPEENEFLEMARKLMNVDPAEERRLEREAALKAFGYTDAELAQLREGLSPDERVWDRFKAFGAGAASGTSGLGALVGGTRASTQEMARQREALSGIVNANRAIREKAFGAGQPVYEQTSADRRAGTDMGQRELEGQRRAQTAREVAQYEAQTRTILENNKQLIELAKTDREAAIAIGAAAMESLASLTGPYSTMYQEAIANFKEALKQADSRDESTKAAARDRMAQAQAQMEEAVARTVNLMSGSSSTQSSYGKAVVVGRQ